MACCSAAFWCLLLFCRWTMWADALLCFFWLFMWMLTDFGICIFHFIDGLTFTWIFQIYVYTNCLATGLVILGIIFRAWFQFSKDAEEITESFGGNRLHRLSAPQQIKILTILNSFVNLTVFKNVVRVLVPTEECRLYKHKLSVLRMESS